MINPFGPYLQILGLPVDEDPVVEGNLHYFDAPGDLFLCYDVCSLQSCVVDSNEQRLSEWKWNPGYTVEALKLVMKEPVAA